MAGALRLQCGVGHIPDGLRRSAYKVRAIIVGAGLSGLIAARHLHRAKWTVIVLDARDQVGGRIQTDYVDGFTLDHGFQVYLTGYQTAGQELDLAKLQLGAFPAGAFVQLEGARYRVCDPLRSVWYMAPWHAMETLLAPVGSIADKLRIAAFRNRVCKSSPAILLGVQNVSAKERLQQMGFSETIIDRFFRPFFGGIFLDDSLSVSAGVMEFVFRTFSQGQAALPTLGMQAIPMQIASDLPRGSIRLRTTVESVSDGSVKLSDGEVLTGDHVIIATEQPAAKRILANDVRSSGLHRASGVVTRTITPASTSCLYFEVIDPPIHEATLVLNGESNGVINNLCFPSFAQPAYAPPGKALLSVSTIGQTESPGTELLALVREQLSEWFGSRASSWRHLKTYRIPYALPNQSLASFASSDKQTKISRQIWRCGDYCETSSIEGAIQSGLNTANQMLSIEPIT